MEHEAQEKKEVEEREAAVQKAAAEVTEKKQEIMRKWKAGEIIIDEANEAVAALEPSAKAVQSDEGIQMENRAVQQNADTLREDKIDEIEEIEGPANQLGQL